METEKSRLHSDYDSQRLVLESQLRESEQQIAITQKEVRNLRTAATLVPSGAIGDSSDEVESLKQELEASRLHLRNARSVSDILDSLPAEDSSKSVAEQVAAQVESLRKILEENHAETVDRLRQQFDTRANTMSKKLSQKLKDGKESLRQELDQEHADAMDRIRKEHQQELEELRKSHQQDLARVKSEYDARLQQEKQIWIAESISQPEPRVKQDTVLSPGKRDLSNLTDDEARGLVSQNPTLKKILESNIRTQIAKRTEVHNREVAEIRQKAEATKSDAVVMEGKRNALKVSMADNKARNLAAQWDVVTRAASETPDKAVKEVWEVAKATKPAVIPAKTIPSTSMTTSNLTAPNQRTSVPSAGSAGGQLLSQQTSNAGGFGQPSAPPTQTEPLSVSTTNGQATETSEQQHPFQTGSPVAQQGPTLSNKPPPTQFGAVKSILGAGQQSAIPRGGMRGGRGGTRGGQQGQQQGNVQEKVSQQALQANQNQHQRGGQHSQLPRGGAAARGGRGGRGGGSQSGSPNRGGLNAGAKQFVPGGAPQGQGAGNNGQKRARDDEGGDGENKRARNSQDGGGM
jgi:nucleoprotein TPR